MNIHGKEDNYLREVEYFLSAHPNILDVQVVGVPDPINEEELMAWIIPKEGIALDEDVVRDFFQGNPSHYKIPKYIEFVEDFPRTASGKIMRFKLQEMSAEKIK